MPWGVLFLRGYIYIYICHFGYPFLQGLYATWVSLLGGYIYATWVSFLGGYIYMPLGYPFLQGIYIYATGGILSGRVSTYMSLGVFFQAGYYYMLQGDASFFE